MELVSTDVAHVLYNRALIREVTDMKGKYVKSYSIE